MGDVDNIIISNSSSFYTSLPGRTGGETGWELLLMWWKKYVSDECELDSRVGLAYRDNSVVDSENPNLALSNHFHGAAFLSQLSMCGKWYVAAEKFYEAKAEKST